MASLSSGTLNLKFMQRAAAKAAASNPKPSSPSAASASSAAPSPAPGGAASSGGTPVLASSSAAAGPSTPAPVDEDRWVLPRPPTTRAAAAPSAAAGPSRPHPVPRVQVSFVASYLPFMEDAPAMSHGGGRRAFGGFGEKPAVAEDAMDEDDEEIEGVLNGDGEAEEVVTTRKDKGKDKARGKSESTRDASDEPRTFKRPAGFDTPPQRPVPSSTTVKQQQQQQHKPSGADKLRATIAGMKSVSVSASPSPTASGASTPVAVGKSKSVKKRAHTPTPSGEDGVSVKRARGEKRTGGASGGGPSKAKGGEPVSLDEREKALKAAKKAQKKKNKAKSG